MYPRMSYYIERDLLKLVALLLENHKNSVDRHHMAMELLDLLQRHSWSCPNDLVRHIINAEDNQALGIIAPLLHTLDEKIKQA